jgi:deferrochelatase/peroxidase EfeB
VELHIQKGIKYYEKPFRTNDGTISKKENSYRNECFAILFLRVNQGSNAIQVRESLSGLWKMYEELEKGKVSDLPNQPVPASGLSVLVGYGPNAFTIPGIGKKIPRDFRDRQFLKPSPRGPILDGSGIRYADDVYENLGTSEHIVVQFISKTQLATYRAIVETWDHLQNINPAKGTLRFTKFFTGFQRDDGRSWLGFHDEVSNMRNTKERIGAIAVDVINNNLVHRDFWTKDGTYLAFLRIEIHLELWRKIERKHQDLLVGRDKLTGIPLAGVDKEGNPVPVEGCPSASKIRSFSKNFHNHPDYYNKADVSKSVEARLDIGASSKVLNQTHIGRTRHLDLIDSADPTSRRIFRQGYEFLEPLCTNHIKLLRVGLNFVSFQNDPGRLFFVLTDPNWLGGTNFGGDGSRQGMSNLLSVLASGVFFVPPVEKPFPGASIFS